MKNRNKPQQLGKKLPIWTFRTVAIFFCVVLLSQSTGANIKGYGLKVAQQTVPNPSIPLTPDKQQRYQEGTKLVKEGQKFEKKRTREGYQQALDKYQQALKIYQELGLRQEEVEILVYIGGAYSGISEKETALNYLQQALGKTQGLKPLYKASILGYIGLIYTSLGRLDDAITYLEKTELIFLQQKKIEVDELALLASSYQSIATVYNRKGEPIKAFDYLNKALKIYRDRLKSLDGEASVLEDIGFIHSLRGETSKAFDKYNQALAIFEKSNNFADYQSEILTLRGMVRTYNSLKNYPKALETAKRALSLSKSKGKNEESKSLNILAYVYESNGQYQKALEIYQTILQYFRQAGLRFDEADMLSNIGMNYTLTNQYKLAINTYNEELKL